MREARIPSALLRPVIRDYLDKQEVGAIQKVGNWTTQLSPTVILANESGVPERSIRHLLAGIYETISFDRADRLFCAMGLGVLGWLQDPELRDAYYSADLSLYDEKMPGAARPGEYFICGCERTEENSKPTKIERDGKRYYTCRRHYNENKRLARLNYGRTA